MKSLSLFSVAQLTVHSVAEGNVLVTGVESGNHVFNLFSKMGSQNDPFLFFYMDHI